MLARVQTFLHGQAEMLQRVFPERSPLATGRTSTQKRSRSSSPKRSRSTAKRPRTAGAKPAKTREELYREATRLGIAGRSKMTKAQLQRAVAARRKKR